MVSSKMLMVFLSYLKTSTAARNSKFKVQNFSQQVFRHLEGWLYLRHGVLAKDGG